MTRPNILLIVTDQHSRPAMSGAGNPHLQTPALDGLARDGVRFDRAYCTAPVCTPARATMFSGHPPSTLGVIVNDGGIPDAFPTLGETLRGAGYRTAYTGKWHLPKGFPEEIRGFEVLHDARALSGKKGRDSDPAAARDAVRFLENPGDDPFCLVVSFQNPHDICYYTRDGKPEPLRVPETLPPLPANHEPAADEPAFIGMCRERAHYGPENTHTVNWSAEDWQRYLSAYYRYTEEVDAHIGTVLDALRASGREDDTLVVYVSDHGEGMAAHRWVVKLMFWENVVGIPLIVRWPGRIPAGAVSRGLVSQLDLVPTLCDYSGAPLPDGCPGLSLRGALEDGKPAGREAVLVELQPDPQDLGVKGRMVVTERFKYGVFSVGERPELLFDLEADPGETLNLAFDPAFAAVRDDHRRLLRDAIARTPDTPDDYPALR